MIDYSKPLTGQVEHGQLLEAVVQIKMAQWSIQLPGDFEAFRRAIVSDSAKAVALMAEAFRQVYSMGPFWLINQNDRDALLKTSPPLAQLVSEMRDLSDQGGLPFIPKPPAPSFVAAEFVRATGKTIQEMRGHLFASNEGQSLYRRGDTILVWVNEGDSGSLFIQQFACPYNATADLSVEPLATPPTVLPEPPAPEPRRIVQVLDSRVWWREVLASDGTVWRQVTESAPWVQVDMQPLPQS